MSTIIYDKENTSIIHRVISSKVFICAQSDTKSCAIIEKSNLITDATLAEMKDKTNPSIVKVVANEKDYLSLKPKLEAVFSNVKFVNREAGFELYYQPFPTTIRVSKTEETQVLGSNAVVEEKIVKVLVVDDSTTICNLLKKIMGLSPLIEVVDTINDPREADAAIAKYKPDVVTLDIHMPHMNGIELLKQIYPKYKIPTIMISSISIAEGPMVFDALDSGAVDYIQKPDMTNFVNIAAEINNTIITASKVKEVKRTRPAATVSAAATCAGVNLDETLILLGASTGGTNALKHVLDKLPDTIPPILIVQHIPAEFSRTFAERLNESVKFTVKEAENGDIVEPNKVLIAPGGKQMKFIDKGGKMSVEINDDAPVNRFQPSVDYLFDSVTKSKCKKHIVSGILTGMGRDGSQGMKRLKEGKGTITIAQDEETSVVFGMPKEAIKLDVVDNVTSLYDFASVIMSSAQTSKMKKAQ